ncbi:hypothetical protein [Mycolicibacterium sp. XJ1819]
MARPDFDDEHQDEPWHHRTPAVVGASIAGLVVIGIVVLVLSYVARQFSEPEQAPLYYVEPSYSATATSSATTTTQTITSTSPPQTTDLEPGASTTSSEITSSTTSETTDTTTETTETTTRTTRRDDGDGSSERTTRRTPRTNVTRTFNPRP